MNRTMLEEDAGWTSVGVAKSSFPKVVMLSGRYGKTHDTGGE